MDNLKVAFDIMPDGKSTPFHYTQTSGHLIFDVSIPLELNSRWVREFHKNPQPEWSTFAVVVSRERIIIALTYDVLDELPVFWC